MINESSLKELAAEELKSAKERLEAAEILLKKDKFIDSVNRAYYAVFNAAKADLHSVGRDAKTHSGLLSEFSLHIIKAEKMEIRYGKILRQIFEARESGDYKIGVVFEKEEIEEIISNARKFIERSKEFVELSLLEK